MCRTETVMKFIGVETEQYWRPRTRSDCEGVPRPCPYVGCRHNLFLDCRGKNKIVFNFPGEPEDMPEDKSCALDVAEHGPMSLEEIGETIGLSHERARQLIDMAVERLRTKGTGEEDEV